MENKISLSCLMVVFVIGGTVCFSGYSYGNPYYRNDSNSNMPVTNLNSEGIIFPTNGTNSYNVEGEGSSTEIPEPDELQAIFDLIKAEITESELPTSQELPDDIIEVENPKSELPTSQELPDLRKLDLPSAKDIPTPAELGILEQLQGTETGNLIEKMINAEFPEARAEIARELCVLIQENIIPDNHSTRDSNSNANATASAPATANADDAHISIISFDNNNEDVLKALGI